jgi:hypothetical protein
MHSATIGGSAAARIRAATPPWARPSCASASRTHRLQQSSLGPRGAADARAGAAGEVCVDPGRTWPSTWERRSALSPDT